MNFKQKEDALHTTISEFSCPVPIGSYDRILLAHGGGGRLTHELIQNVFLPQFGNELLNAMHDGAVATIGDTRLAFTTDSYVVDPIFFPGGDIGKLAVHGTVNDLAMCGARPLYLSAAFIIEEGFPMGDLQRIVTSMKEAAASAGVLLVTGDTKVVERGKADRLFITTSGIGVVERGVTIAPSRANVGDKIILNGTIGEHGIAIMSVREGLEFESPIVSDTAPLNDLVMKMLDASKEIHVLRDPTRGGIATVLNELAHQARIGITVSENDIPVSEGVRGACEILGLDPLYVANEGKLIAVVDPAFTDKVLAVMHDHPLGKDATIIGEVVGDHPGVVIMKTTIGGHRIVDMLSGEQLPRIC